jgi:hypothetical protein
VASHTSLFIILLFNTKYSNSHSLLEKKNVNKVSYTRAHVSWKVIKSFIGLPYNNNTKENFYFFFFFIVDDDIKDMDGCVKLPEVFTST